MTAGTKPAALDALVDLGNTINSKAPSEWLAEFPVLGTVAKIYAAGKSFSDASLARKLAGFISSLDDRQEHVRERLRTRAAESPAELESVGELISQAVALSLDFKKPQILAKLYFAYLDRVIDATQLGRFVTIVSATHTPDIERFAALPSKALPGGREPLTNEERWWVKLDIAEPLAPSGLVKATSFSVRDTAYLVTPSGEAFHAALEHANSILGGYHERG